MYVLIFSFLFYFFKLFLSAIAFSHIYMYIYIHIYTYIYKYICIYIIGLLALVIYFGRKNNLSSANKLPKKILIWGWQKNAVLRILGSALATYILYVLCCTLWFYITWVISLHGMMVYILILYLIIGLKQWNVLN